MRAWLTDVLDGLGLVAFLAGLYFTLPILADLIHR